MTFEFFNLESHFFHKKVFELYNSKVENNFFTIQDFFTFFLILDCVI